jgi:hypothetical protein
MRLLFVFATAERLLARETLPEIRGSISPDRELYQKRFRDLWARPSHLNDRQAASAGIYFSAEETRPLANGIAKGLTCLNPAI